MADSSGENEPRLEQVDDINISDSSRVASTKQPPQELAESIYIRRLVIFSFWVVVVVFGLPTWWWTTSIHRARLPLQDMMDWADGKVLWPLSSCNTTADGDAPSRLVNQRFLYKSQSKLQCYKRTKLQIS